LGDGIVAIRALALAAVLAACGKSILDAPVTSDAAARDTPATETPAERPTDRPREAPVCCPIQTPSCNCFQIGGSPDPFGRCPAICDAGPMNWKMSTDANGCPLLVQDPPGASCLVPPPRDGGDGG